MMPKKNSCSRAEDARPKTLAEHREYLHEIVRLKVWYLWCRLHTYPEEDLRRMTARDVTLPAERADTRAGERKAGA